MRKKSLILSAFVISVLLAGACAVLVSDEENSAALPRSISILPASGDVGTTVTVTGSGFNAEEVITILFADAVVATDPSVVETDGSGAFTATFEVPSQPLGNYTIVATVAGKSGSAVFTIAEDSGGGGSNIALIAGAAAAAVAVLLLAVYFVFVKKP